MTNYEEKESENQQKQQNKGEVNDIELFQLF